MKQMVVTSEPIPSIFELNEVPKINWEILDLVIRIKMNLDHLLRWL